eukprot:6226449-Amphidinium_carterae.1
MSSVRAKALAWVSKVQPQSPVLDADGYQLVCKGRKSRKSCADVAKQAAAKQVAAANTQPQPPSLPGTDPKEDHKAGHVPPSMKSYESMMPAYAYWVKMGPLKPLQSSSNNPMQCEQKCARYNQQHTGWGLYNKGGLHGQKEAALVAVHAEYARRERDIDKEIHTLEQQHAQAEQVLADLQHTQRKLVPHAADATDLAKTDMPTAHFTYTELTGFTNVAPAMVTRVPGFGPVFEELMSVVAESCQPPLDPEPPAKKGRHEPGSGVFPTQVDEDPPSEPQVQATPMEQDTPVKQ